MQKLTPYSLARRMHACMAAVPMVEPMPLFPPIENTAPLSMVMVGWAVAEVHPRSMRVT